MNKLEKAIIYATEKFEGLTRKITGYPHILHSLEVAQILTSMTSDMDLITAGVLHDIVEDTDGTLLEIEEQFGHRVAELVASETEARTSGENKESTWLSRKQQSIDYLRNTHDNDVRMLWLADKLSNIRSIADCYSEKGDEMWEAFNQKDPDMHRWYYVTIAEILEMHLNRTGAFKEFLKHINFLWPGSFESDKERYRKYHEISLEGCPVIGKGSKSVVYQYDDDVVVKVYNDKNIYKDIERENLLAKKAFFSDIPTAISFGIVTVGDRYGSMFEMLDSSSVSTCIERNPTKLDYYAGIMADLAKKFHRADAVLLQLDDFMPEVYKWADGLKKCDLGLYEKVNSMLHALPEAKTAIHGDFHTGNVIMQRGDPLIIDMDRFTRCHPIVDLCGMYMSYIAFGEIDAHMLEDFMGFSTETAKTFYDLFIHKYFDGKSEEFIEDANRKIALLCYTRLVRRAYKKGDTLSESDRAARDFCLERIRSLINEVDSFEI